MCFFFSLFPSFLLSPSLFFSLSEETRDTESEKNHDFFILSVYSNAVVIPKLPPITLFVGKFKINHFLISSFIGAWSEITQGEGAHLACLFFFSAYGTQVSSNYIRRSI